MSTRVRGRSRTAGRPSFESFPDWAARTGWKPLLQTWTELIEKYSAVSTDEDRDVAYWYGERALVGLLAAAAWQHTGGWSLVEFLGRRKHRSSRGDLWLGTGKGDFTVEAKVDWGKKKPSDTASSVENRLKEARKQAESHALEYRVGQPVALCFLVPERSKPIPRGHFASVVGQLACDERLIVTLEAPAEYKKKHYAGVMVVADLCDWAGAGH